MSDNKKKVYLTIHGHFYQPPRENPWLEDIEEQESANPFHDWNERIDHECYTPNSVARITDSCGKILDIVNNYSLISYNFGPTLLSWLQKYSPKTYQRILDADKISAESFSGHGNAIAQVYNHIIMPLANDRDKFTQTYWGIRDFESRFGRYPEGIWLSEAAVCDDTLAILVDLGIKYTILSPYQVEKVKYSSEDQWQDVSKGNIDPARAYRYNIQKHPGKSIDIFFYDGSISKSIAFEGVLYNGDNLFNRIKQGVVGYRNYDQLVHLATDGESYGHHTPFGNMALAYGLKVRTQTDNMILTNYGEYLEKYPPESEVIIKENTAWSCSHGVGRWNNDCGCSTGGYGHWNQKWRKPLRESLDWLNDKLAEIYEKEGKRFFKDVWSARNNYVSVLLDNSDENIDAFIEGNTKREVSKAELVDCLKLLEMQKNAMYMFTSCGWFFSEISGIETVQIMKYAARAMQLAYEFGYTDLEEDFLEKLSVARSNIKQFGNGADVYKRFVKPSIISNDKIISHWAITSLYEDYEDETDLYCFKIRRHDYEKQNKASTTLVVGRVELTSKVIKETNDMIFALMQIGDNDFHCVIRGYGGSVEYKKIKEDLFTKLNNASITEVIRGLDQHFGKEYCTLKELFLDKKKQIIQELIKGQLNEFSSLYNRIYSDSQASMRHLNDLNLSIPDEFKIAAQYTLSRKFNNSVIENDDYSDIDNFQEALSIHKEADQLRLQIDKSAAEKAFKKLIEQKMVAFVDKMSVPSCDEIIDILEVAEELQLNLNLGNSQNIYFAKLCNGISELVSDLPNSKTKEKDKELITVVFKLGEKLSFNLDKYYAALSRSLAKNEPIDKVLPRVYKMAK